MRPRPVIPSQLAERDVAQSLAYYLNESAWAAATGFIAALEKAYSHIARHPDSESARHAHELGLPGLRCWPLAGYPHIVFYLQQEDHIRVWRVLHGQRAIPASLQ